jgi:hypothetical protein
VLDLLAIFAFRASSAQHIGYPLPKAFSEHRRHDQTLPRVRITLDHRVTDPNSIPQRFRSATKLVSGQRDAFRAMLVHNHPSGDSKPWRDDIETTQEIAKAAEAQVFPSTTTW